MDNQEHPIGALCVFKRPGYPQDNTVVKILSSAIFGPFYDCIGGKTVLSEGLVQSVDPITPVFGSEYFKGRYCALVAELFPLEDPDEDSLCTEGELHTPWAAKGIRERVEELSKELNNHV